MLTWLARDLLCPYKEQKGLPKPTAAVMLLHQIHANIFLPSISASMKEFPAPYSLMRSTRFYISGLENICSENSRPLFPLLCNWSVHLYTATQGTAAKNIFVVQLSVFGTDSLFALNGRIGVGRIYCLPTHGYNPRVWPKTHSHLTVNCCLRTKAEYTVEDWTSWKVFKYSIHSWADRLYAPCLPLCGLPPDCPLNWEPWEINLLALVLRIVPMSNA